MKSDESVLWKILDTQAYSGIESLVENILILMHIRWLDQNSHALIAEKNRWQHWTSLPEHLRFAYLKDKFYPLLQTHAPMSGHLIGLILPTIPLGIPSAHALSQLLKFMQTHSETTVLDQIAIDLGQSKLNKTIWTEILRHAELKVGDTLWEPFCQNAEFLSACAHYQKTFFGLESIKPQMEVNSALGSCLWGRVKTRTDALLSAYQLLLVNQYSPHLDAYSLPRPAPNLIWMRSSYALAYPDLIDLLAPGGRLLIWHEHAHRQTIKLANGGLEVIQKQRIWQIREQVVAYHLESSQKFASAG